MRVSGKGSQSILFVVLNLQTRISSVPGEENI